MNAPLIFFITTGCVLGGTLLGILLRSLLPERHLGDESKDAVRAAAGLLATMTALLLGLLIASAKQSYDNDKRVVVEFSAKIALLDRMLAAYGGDADAARASLREVMHTVADRMWPSSTVERVRLDPIVADAEPLFRNLQQLSPANADQDALRERALEMTADLAQLRWVLFGQSGGSNSKLLLAMVILWLMFIFISFGLYGPANTTVRIALALCGLCVSCAVFLILELDQPFTGMIRISDAPMRGAIAHMGPDAPPSQP